MLKKTKKSIRRLGAVVMALAMAMSVMAINAFAANNPETVTITKTLTKSADAPVPNTTFTFAIAAGDAGVYEQDGQTDISITPGEAMNNVTTGEGVESPDGTTVTYTATITLPAYTAAGIYSYKVSEVAGDYNGIVYDNTVYNMNVFVNNSNEVYAVTVNNKGLGTAEGKASLNFTNSYATKAVTVKKVITGNQADTTEEFGITITINGTPGKSYTVVNGATTTTITADTNGVASTTIDLGNNETYTVSGLSANDTYTVNEAQPGEYTVSYEGDYQDAHANNNTVTVTNTKNATTPTGVIMNIAPYVLMVALASGIAFFFLRRKHAE